MKTLRPTAIFLVFFCIALLPLQSAESAKSGFLGWIPVQFVPAGSDLVLDMHRFFEPEKGETLRLPAPGSKSGRATFDADRFELNVSVAEGEKGLIDIPLEVTNGDCPTGRTGILTIAVGEPGGRPGNLTVFAETQAPGLITFRVSSDSPVTRISTVVERPDGSSSLVESERKGDSVSVPTTGLPDGTWIRVVAADDQGRVSRAIRALVRPTDAFQWQDGMIYYAFTDRFVDGDTANDRPVNDPAVLPQANYYGGDFEGIQQKVEDGYFKKIGVNVLWLAPLNRNPDDAWREYLPPYRTYTGYHGYWPVSRSEIEPRFGGEKGLKDLINSAQQRGIKIIADLVLKHSHIEDPMYKDHRDWYGTLELPDGKKNLRMWDEHQFTTWFEEWLPGFDFDNPKPVAFLISNAQSLAEKFSLDGYRLDAVKHIKYSFWPKFRSAMRNMQQTHDMGSMYFVGETFMDRRGIMSFVGPNMLDGQFDFPLYDTIMDVFAKGQKGFSDLEDSLSASETIYGKETLMSPLIGNHDKSRFMAYADGDLPDAKNPNEVEVGWSNPPQVDNPASYEKLKLALGFLFSIDGVPMTYYGDEVGLTGAGDPDNRRMFPAEEKLSPEQKSVREHFSKLTALRSAHPALRYGSRRLLLAEENRYAFVRRHFDDKVLAVWNRGSETAEFHLPVGPELPDGKYADALSGEAIEVQSGAAKFSLPPMRCAFFCPEK